MASLRKGINDKCKECIYDPGNGNGSWREQVAGCTASNCPLHPLRPQTAAKCNRSAPPQVADTLDTGRLL